MSNNKLKTFMILDGNEKQSKKIVEDFLNTITDKEKEESMSEEYDYLDEE